MSIDTSQLHAIAQLFLAAAALVTAFSRLRESKRGRRTTRSPAHRSTDR